MSHLIMVNREPGSGLGPESVTVNRHMPVPSIPAYKCLAFQAQCGFLSSFSTFLPTPFLLRRSDFLVPTASEVLL